MANILELRPPERVASYERLKRGDFKELENIRGFGHLLISPRIAKGISQRDLARRLNECNEYFGITLERAVRTLDALDGRLIAE